MAHSDQHSHGPHSHSHDHDHGDVFHTHAPAGKMRLAFLLTLIILTAEIIGGVISHSLALISDAGHVITDLGAIGLSWFALRQADKPVDKDRTFGYHRAGILAAFVNGMTLIIITIVILWQAVQRLTHPVPVHSTWMVIGAGVGLAVNLYLGLGMRHEENLNVRSAVLHIIGDAVASAGVIVGGIIIQITGWGVIDPLLSIGIAILIAFSAWRIVKQTIVILMEGTPKNVDIDEVMKEILSVDGVKDVHDLHVWSITSGKNALSCHIVVNGELCITECQQMLRTIEHRLAHTGIEHVTIQPEDSGHSHPDSVLCGELSSSIQHSSNI